MQKSFAIRAAFGALALTLSAAVHAAFPEKPVRIIVPYPAGGTQDAMMRAFAERFQRLLGQPLITENKAGAAGVVGTQEVARSAPDGHTLGLANNGMVITPLINSGVASFDLGRDLAPVTMVASGPIVMFANPRVPGSDAAALIAHARTQPNGLTYASTGLGGGVKLTHVPYKGSTPGRIAVVAGETEIMFDGLLPARPLIESGKLKALAVTSAKRSSVMPQLPTIAETLPGYEADTWYALFAPGGTPRDIVNALHGVMAKALQTKEVRDRLLSQGAEPSGRGPDELRAFVKSEMTKWGKVIQSAGVKPE